MQIQKNILHLEGEISLLNNQQRPCHVEHTSSRPITEVKQHWARLVLGWETAWEHRVLLFLFFCILIISILFHYIIMFNNYYIDGY